MKLLSFSLVISILLVSCGEPPQPQAPIVVPPNQVSGITTANSYVNILINSVGFPGKVSNIGNEGNLQLFMIVSDDSGHADVLICPYGSVIQVHQGDKVNPCKAGLAYPANLLQNNLYVMLVAVDVKDTSVLTEIGFGALSSSLALGLHTAILALAPINPASGAVIIGFLAMDTVIGYAGSKAQDYFQKNYVIGSQSVALSRQYNWNNGNIITAQSTNGQVNFTFNVQESSTAEGKIVEATPAAISVPPTSAPPASTVNTQNMTGKWKFTLNVTDVIPGYGMKDTCVSPSNITYDFVFNQGNDGNISGYYSLPPVQGLTNYGQYPISGTLDGNQFSFTSSMTDPSDDCNGNINSWQGSFQNNKISGTKTIIQKGNGACCTYVGTFTGVTQ